MPAFNPERFALTARALDPAPIDCEAVDEKLERVLLVPHSNHAVVDEPFGFSVAFSVAALVVIDVAAVVVTVGRIAPVVKLRIPSRCVPTLFCAATR